MFKEVFANVGFANNLSGKILEISSDKKSLIVEVPGVYGLNPSKKYQKRKVFSSIEVQPQRTGSMTFLKSEVQRPAPDFGLILDIFLLSNTIEMKA